MKESDIRSDQILLKYQNLVDADSRKLLKKKFRNINLSKLGIKNTKFGFKKKGYDYIECIDTGSLIVNPRPSNYDLSQFYKKSKSNDFWYKNFFLPKLQQRINFVIKPKIDYLVKNFPSYKNKKIIDIGCGSGHFLINIKKKWKNAKLFGLEPSISMSKSIKNKKIKIFNGTIENFRSKIKFDVATCFELFEHVHDPGIMIKSISNILSKNGLLYLSTLNANGFDIKYLKENSKSIYPPYHLNFFTVKSMEKLLKLNGFKKINIITPGKLDFEIVRKNKKNIKDPVIKEIFSLLSKRLNDKEISKFQKIIQFNKLSSHMLVIAKK